MKTTEELKEMELGDLMDHLIEAEDTIKYCSYSRRDVDNKEYENTWTNIKVVFYDRQNSVLVKSAKQF